MDFSEVYPDSCSSVALAARNGNLTKLKELIEKKKPCDARDNRGWRPIHEAAYWNNSDCLQHLLSLKEIDVNSTTFEGQTALWLAASNNCISSVQTLVAAKAVTNIPNNEDVTPLHTACSKGFIEVVDLLIKSGANLDMKDYGLFTPLHEAAIPGHVEVVEMLLRNGADNVVRDSHGRTPLFCAAQSHSCLVVSLLLSGASPSLISMRAGDGATAVMLAAQSGCLECVKLMIDHGADVDLKAHDGVMAVHLALTCNHKEVLRFLLKITDHTYIEQSCLAGLHKHHRGAELNWDQPGMESVNIFTLAVTYDRFDLVETLIEEGLNPDRFPCQWKFNDTLGSLQLEGTHKWKWGSPLSFILSYSPFNEKSAQIVEFLVLTGSDVNSSRSDFIPPFIAAVTAAGWQNEQEWFLLSNALKILVQKRADNRLRTHGIAELINAALSLNPRALISLIQTGYIVDASAIVKFIENSHDIPTALGPVQTKYLSILSAAGFFTAFKSLNKHEFKVHSLMELSRHRILSALCASRVDMLISQWDIWLPKKLISYLCFDDIKNS